MFSAMTASDATGVFICKHVFQGHPVLFASRVDGDWQLLCGGIHDDGDGMVAHLRHLIDGDPSIEAILDLPAEFEAERDAVGSPWVRRPALPSPD
jgi:hypothetical protein